MDINYLLRLQSIRVKCGAAVENVFSVLTDIPFNPLTVILVCVIYWCIEKRTGLFVLFSQTFGSFVNNLIKLCVCAFRPWIRDPRIKPPAKALEGATGYSFPSGHSQTVMGIYGAIGWTLIQKDRESKKKKWLWAVILCAVVILFVAFSRNFLSVHTPQDVAVGLCVAAILVYLSDKIIAWEAEGCKKGSRDLLIALCGTALVVLATVFIMSKPYPRDKAADGSLLVDPEKMKTDFFTAAGSFLAVLWGWFVEKRWIKFSTSGSVPEKIIRAVCGALVVGAVYCGFHYIKGIFPSLFVYYTVKMFVTYFVVMAGYPAVFAAVSRKISKRKS